jgi:hypothetical protein
MQLSTLVTMVAYAAAIVSALPHVGTANVKIVTIKTTVNKITQACGNNQQTFCCTGALSCSAAGE